jgi:hypothetical protein
MAGFTRRRFLVQSSFGLSAAAFGGALVAAAPRVLAARPAAPAAVGLNTAELSGPLVAHVRNAATGEVSLMVGTTETVYRDPDLVGRLVAAAANRRQV